MLYTCSGLSVHQCGLQISIKSLSCDGVSAARRREGVFFTVQYSDCSGEKLFFCLEMWDFKGPVAPARW